MSTSVDLDDLLLAHAAGHLPPALAMVVDAHLALSARSHARYRLLLELGGMLLERLEPAPLRESDPERLLARTATADPELSPGPLGWIERLQANVVADLAAVDGLPVLQMPVPVPGGPQEGMCATLLRLAPEAALPPHGHPGLEVTLVLEGELADARGRFGRGDLVVCDETVVHAPAAGPAGCLALALLCCRQPIARPTSRAARVLGP